MDLPKIVSERPWRVAPRERKTWSQSGSGVAVGERGLRGCSSVCCKNDCPVLSAFFWWPRTRICASSCDCISARSRSSSNREPSTGLELFHSWCESYWMFHARGFRGPEGQRPARPLWNKPSPPTTLLLPALANVLSTWPDTLLGMPGEVRNAGCCMRQSFMRQPAGPATPREGCRDNRTRTTRYSAWAQLTPHRRPRPPSARE